MQIVDPNAPRPKKRTKKEYLPTPEEYESGWSHRSCSLSGGTYWPRAKDKGAIYAKHMKEAIKSPVSLPYRAVIFSTGKKGLGHSPVFGAKHMSENEILNLNASALPAPSADLRNILEMAKDQKAESNITRIGDRINSILGMLGGAEPVDPVAVNTVARYARRARGWKVNGYTLVLLEGRDE